MIGDRRVEAMRSGGNARVAIATTIVLAMAGLAGCGGTKPSRYYQLTVPGGSAPPAASPSLPLTILVTPIRTSMLYKDTRLVYSVGPEEMGTYAREQWVGPPPALIQEVLLRQLRSTGLYEGVYYPESSIVGDFALYGRLFDFKEVDSGATVVARLNIDLEMRNLKSLKTVWVFSYVHDEPVSAKTVPDVVAAMNSNVLRMATQASTEMQQYFTSHPMKQTEHAQR
jgi:ABC-type uncharacterized transport system auxiliary subunit